MTKISFTSIACVLGLIAFEVSAQIGDVKNSTIRPVLDNAKVEGCKIAKPGEYEAQVGDLIELDYTYPVVPGAMPKKFEFKLEGGKTIISPSPLGIRRVVSPKLVGATT